MTHEPVPVPLHVGRVEHLEHPVPVPDDDDRNRADHRARQRKVSTVTSPPQHSKIAVTAQPQLSHSHSP